MNNIIKRISVPKQLLIDFDILRFIILKLFNLLQNSNFNELFDFENKLNLELQNFLNYSIWELQKYVSSTPFPIKNSIFKLN